MTPRSEAKIKEECAAGMFNQGNVNPSIRSFGLKHGINSSRDTFSPKRTRSEGNDMIVGFSDPPPRKTPAGTTGFKDGGILPGRRYTATFMTTPGNTKKYVYKET